jgi:hypothetical protein
MSRVLIYDEKITTEKDNIAQAKKALEQMNAQVDQMLSRTDSERGTDKAVIVRKQQAKERAELQASINKSQKEIQRLQTERAPLAAESRKIEAEVGPIKYIAALLYGDNPDQNILERAVRWVIIIIVLVFDPLALVLILAAQQSFNWAREDKEKAIDQLEQSSTNKIDNEDENTDRASSSEDVSHTADAGDGNLQPQSNQIGLTPEETQAFLDQVKRNEEEYLASLNEEIKTEAEFFDRAEYAALTADILDEQNRATEANAAAAEIEKPEPSYEADDGPLTDDQIAQIKDSVEEEKTVSTVAATEEPPAESPPLAEGLMEEEKSVEVAQNIEDTPPPPAPRDNVKIKKMEGGYWDVNSKIMSTEVLSVTNPELYKKYVLEADNVNAEDITSGFGTSFPHQPRRGDMFLRVDYQPNKLFKFNGVKWIEINKDSTNAYAYDEQYLNFLIEKLRSGEYELDQLSDTERELVENKLNNIVHQESKNDKT